MVRELPEPGSQPNRGTDYSPAHNRHAGRHDPRHGARQDNRIWKSRGAPDGGRAIREIVEGTDAISPIRGRDACDGLVTIGISGDKMNKEQSTVRVDRQKLAAWIQPQHLEESALEQYQQKFTSHPAHL